VPDVVGRTEQEARQILGDAGFTLIQTTPEESGDVPEGSVISTDPAAGAQIPADQQITLVVAAGPTTVEVPNVVGQSEQQATQTLQGAGLQVNRQEASSNDQPPGTVINQDPGAGAPVAPNATVTIVVSTGAAQTQVPDVVGRREDSATQLLQNAGFEVSTVDEETLNPADDGRVVDQNPAGGSNANEGATVTLVIGRFAAGPTSTDPGGGG